ncbi:MAG: hypothetical protein JSS96_07665 [Bacteroidetes bacterium]|nr:hypothetical protein [Bacteroidota bacterium]
MNYYNDFDIACGEKISILFVERNIYTFSEAAQHIKSLPYKRNKNKKDIACVLLDNYGTCSTKHALLKQLAIENEQPDFKLMMGMYKMSAYNTPHIAPVLHNYKLDYIPEAHNYLRYHNLILEFTSKKSTPADFIEDLIEEKEILPQQVTDFKVCYHKDFISRWQKSENIPYSTEELWEIREKCIKSLSEHVLPA